MPRLGRNEGVVHALEVDFDEFWCGFFCCKLERSEQSEGTVGSDVDGNIRGISVYKVMLNIRELAHLAKVSPSAVSLALRGKSGVSDKTRAHIVKIAEQHGYRPNPMVSALMTQAGTRRRRRLESIIGFLTTMDVDHYPQHSTPYLYHTGIKRAAELAGYVIEPFTFTTFDKKVPLARMLEARQIHGLILHLMQDEFERLNLDRSRYAFVSVGTPTKQREVDFVCNDHGHTMRLAILKLWELGYRRLGLALDGRRPEHVESTILMALLEWQFRQTEGSILPLVTTDWSPSTLLEWYKREKPDAIICSDHLAIQWLQKAGINIPEGVAFAHLDIDPRWQDIAGVNQCNEEVGAATMDLLISQLNGNRFGLPKHPRTVTIQGLWQDGRTAPPKR